jgi:hypothetical protein
VRLPNDFEDKPKLPLSDKGFDCSDDPFPPIECQAIANLERSHQLVSGREDLIPTPKLVPILDGGHSGVATQAGTGLTFPQSFRIRAKPPKCKSL